MDSGMAVHRPIRIGSNASAGGAIVINPVPPLAHLRQQALEAFNILGR